MSNLPNPTQPIPNHTVAKLGFQTKTTLITAFLLFSIYHIAKKNILDLSYQRVKGGASIKQLCVLKNTKYTDKLQNIYNNKIYIYMIL